MFEKIPKQTPEKRRFQENIDFHEKKWKKKAEQHAARGFFERWMSGDRSEKDADDFMHAEAERDNADYSLRKSERIYQPSTDEMEANPYREEAERWEQKTKAVCESFVERIENSEGSDVETLVIFTHGGMKAATVAGDALALNILGADQRVLDNVVGVSSGVVAAERLVAGRESLLKGIAMLIGPLATKKFINLLRLKAKINIPYLKELEDEGEFALDTKAIQEARSGLWVVTTDPVVGNSEATPRILDQKKLEGGPTMGPVLSMSIPGVTGKIHKVDGREQYDGGFATLPIQQIVEKFKPKDPAKHLKVLVFTQHSFEGMENIKPSTVEEMAATILRSASLPTRLAGHATASAERAIAKFSELVGMGKTAEAMRTAPIGLASLAGASWLDQMARGLVLKQHQRETLEAIERETGAEIGVVFAPPSELSMTSIDSADLESAVRDAFFHVFELFGKEPPDEMPQYVSEERRKQLADAISNFEKQHDK
jgi:hypothetical protein